MKTKMVVFAITLMLLTSAVHAFQVDGGLSDWGVTPGTDWVPNAGIDSWEEDSVDYSNSGYVGPGYGGQPWDVELLMASVDDGKLYLAVVAGTPPDGSYSMWQDGVLETRGNYYYPGDIGLDLNGDGVFEIGLETTGYSDNILGGDPALPGGDGHTYDPSLQGNIYAISDAGGWNVGYSSMGSPVTEIDYSDPSKLTLLGNTMLVYIQDTDPDHYVMETYIDLGLLDLDDVDEILFHFSVTCGNDIGEVLIPGDSIDLLPGGPTVPEPATIFLLSMGIAGTRAMRRNK